MFRSTSPAPSIAPSFESTAPSAWTDIDPLRSESTRTRRSKSLTPANERDQGGEVSFEPRVQPSAGMGIGSFNAGWGWDEQDGDSGNEADSYDNRTSRRNKGGGMFSRVFKSEAGSLNVSGQLKSGSSRSGQTWSDSTDLLHPYNTSSDARSSHSQASSASQHRSKTPPARLTPTSPMGLKSPPASKQRGSKNRRPMSLNINMADPAPPPPTFNNLPPEARTDLLKKNRKLQQMLGHDYYNAATSINTHRVTASEDNNPISGLVSGMANLGKKSSGRKSGEASLASSRASYRAMSDSLAGAGSQPGPDLSSSHILLNQGSTVDDSLKSRKRSSSTRLSKTRPTTPKYTRPTHPGSRSRSFSVSSTPLSPVPPTPESFMDFSSDAGELFVATPHSLRGPSTGPLSPTDTLFKFTLGAIPPSPGKGTAPSQAHLDVPTSLDRSKTPRPRDIVTGLSVNQDSSDPRLGRSLEQRVSTHTRSSSTPPVSPLPGPSTHPYAISGRSHSVSSISTLDTAVIPDADAVDRKRRRDQLAKLHRYLGSNVPTEAVLGVDAPKTEGLPARVDPPAADEESSDEEGPKWWKGLKKSSSDHGGDVVHSIRNDRNQALPEEPMTEQDRALNVKRKLKISKIFGEAPPQSMYMHKSKSKEDEPSEDEVPEEDPPSPDRSLNLNSLEFLRHSHSLNSLNYLVDKEDRDSLRDLFNELTKQDPLSDVEEDIVFAPPEDLDDDDDDELLNSRKPKRQTRQTLRGSGAPTITLSFRSSPLLSSPLSSSLSPTWGSSPISPAGSSRPYSPKSPIGRNSLAKKPSESSFTSIDVEPVTADGFQQRRKRAAKLTLFFGEDYRSLFGEVLESIESGVKDDQTKGSLTEDEAKELYRKLQKLKAKQDSIIPSSSSSR